MMLEEIRELAARGESDRLEFKTSTGELEAAMRTLCGMLNGSGGCVLVGVGADGSLRGQQVSDGTLKELAAKLGKFDPPALPTVDRVSMPEGREILVLNADRGGMAPYVYDGKPYVRVQSTTSIMPQRVYQRRLLERDHARERWETLPAPALPLDMEEVARCLRDAAAAGRIESSTTNPAEALERLGLMRDGVVSQAAVVAFAREPFPAYPQCALRLARFRGTTKAEFLDQNQMTGHAFRLLREADLFLRRHLPVAGRLVPGVLERQDEPLFPPLALREALVNAFVHRDYAIAGGAVSVAVFDDRLEISSSGGLPFGLTPADLRADHVSKPRNPLLADVFFRRGLIERWGRGTQKIVALCVAAGHPEPQFEERAGDVVVRFIPAGYTPPHRIEHDLADRQRRILFALRDGVRLGSAAIRDAVDPQLPRTTLREELSLLRTLGLVDGDGTGRGAVWWLRRDVR